MVLFAYSEVVHLNEAELGLLMIKLIPIADCGWKIAALLIGLGTLLGVWGSVISVRKYLKV